MRKFQIQPSRPAAHVDATASSVVINDEDGKHVIFKLYELRHLISTLGAVNAAYLGQNPVREDFRDADYQNFKEF